MNDGELLKLAAKAAGIEWVDGHVDVGLRNSAGQYWNPLKDDGDALRLAVQIGRRNKRGYFALEVMPTCTQATCMEPFEHTEFEYHDPDGHYAATRRAIVRAAAEIVGGRDE